VEPAYPVARRGRRRIGHRPIQGTVGRTENPHPPLNPGRPPRYLPVRAAVRAG
jgi:hypothetical protein